MYFLIFLTVSSSSLPDLIILVSLPVGPCPKSNFEEVTFLVALSEGKVSGLVS